MAKKRIQVVEEHLSQGDYDFWNGPWGKGKYLVLDEDKKLELWLNMHARNLQRDWRELSDGDGWLVFVKSPEADGWVIRGYLDVDEP